jgi:hypothetical protein
MEAINALQIPTNCTLESTPLECKNFKIAGEEDKIMDSDDSDFYVGEPSIINQNEQVTEIGLSEIDNQEIKDGEPDKTSLIPPYCALGPTELKCRLLKIAEKLSNIPTFHIEINKKIYIYRIHGIRSDNKIILKCTKESMLKGMLSTCGNLSYISASELLQKLITNTPSSESTVVCLAKNHSSSRTKSTVCTPLYLRFTDPRVYDIENYDMNSFEIGIGRVRTWVNLYLNCRISIEFIFV